MSFMKVGSAVALAAALASGQSGCQAQHPSPTQPDSQVQPDPAPQQQVLDPVAPIPGDEWFAGYPMEPGMGEAVLCEEGRVVDYWPHQEWKKAKASAECQREDEFTDEVVRRVNALESANNGTENS